MKLDEIGILGILNNNLFVIVYIYMNRTGLIEYNTVKSLIRR